MKVLVILLVLVGFVTASYSISDVSAICMVNEDWPDAPCLDGVVGGHYEQHEVNQWAKYYQYKGAEFMEQKRAEMNDAIENGVLKEWVAESTQNENVYSYYFFSGRAPDVGLYHAQFEEFGVWENRAIHEPFENNDVVIVGTVVQVTTTENKTQYDFKVDEYLKGEKPFDLITAILDSPRPSEFPKDPLDYFNKPYFEKDNQVFVYLKQDGSTFQVSPYSFTIKKPTTAGPPFVIHPSGPQQYIIPQGEEIIISGTVKKSYLYSLEQSNIDSSFDLVVLYENEEKVDSKKLDINLDGSYSFTFQEKDELRIPGKYSWEIAYHNGGMGGEFIVKTDQKRWTPLKQIQSGIPFNEIQCNQNLVLLQKHDGSPACVTESTKQKLIERGWTTKDSSAQKIIERLKQGSQPVNEVDARYVETLALMNQNVSNFVYGVDWTSHCCGYSEKDDSYELTITFMDSDNQRQFGVTFDLDTMQIIDMHESDSVRIGKGLSSESVPYRLVALREFPDESAYYHKINSISEIPYVSKLNEDKTTIITSEQFDELLEWFPQKCLENNSSYDCSNTPPIFEYESTKYLVASHGLDATEVYCESGLLYVSEYEKVFPDRKLENFVPVKCITPTTK